MKRSALFIITFIFLYACSTVPITGRKQLSIIPNSQILPLSFDSYQQVLSESKLSTNKEQTAMVKKVGVKIEQAVEQYMTQHKMADALDGYAWEFNLIQDDATVNAWCMPGGKVAFYTGIMPICQDEAGVAVVMGHEVAHAIANHGRERMSQGLVQQMGGVALAVAMQDKPEETQALFFAAYAVGTTYGAMLPYSRLHESEADKLGLIFMAMAGYDPHEAPKFWERMASQSGGSQPPEWMSTHPSHESRIQALNDYMPTAMKYYNKQQKPTTKGGLIKR
ncbi:MAG TPA: M48 family metallopeptidase [Bacteroidales bacterium]|nr:M48 family metallopeptidase [Bacteroidales bacterium]HRX95372.1 M48 family metallopeptidase [Bacteroidales bacterium]